MNEILTFIFYFVFNIMFKDHPKYGIIKTALTVLFMVLAILLIVYGKKRADRVASIHYKVTNNGLTYFDGKNKTFYAWADFLQIRRNPNLISRIYPFEFVTREETFTLHRQVDKADELIPLIGKKTGIKVNIYK